MSDEQCNYTGSDFGATYHDSVCIGGQLYNADDCDSKGNLYEPVEFVPCPKCNHDEWLERFRDNVLDDGYTAAEDGKPESACPWPMKAIQNPKEGCEEFAAPDGEKLKEWWLAGYRQQQQEAK